MTHPILRPGRYPFWRAEADLLWRRLFQRFADQQVIARLYSSCAENLRPLNLQPGPDRVWPDPLSALAVQAARVRLTVDLDAELELAERSEGLWTREPGGQLVTAIRTPVGVSSGRWCRRRRRRPIR